MKSNVLPFPSLRKMPPDPPRHRWLRTFALQLCVLAAVIGVIILVNVLFGH